MRTLAIAALLGFFTIGTSNTAAASDFCQEDQEVMVCYQTSLTGSEFPVRANPLHLSILTPEDRVEQSVSVKERVLRDKIKGEGVEYEAKISGRTKDFGYVSGTLTWTKYCEQVIVGHGSIHTIGSCDYDSIEFEVFVPNSPR